MEYIRIKLDSSHIHSTLFCKLPLPIKNANVALKVKYIKFLILNYADNMLDKRTHYKLQGKCLINSKFQIPYIACRLCFVWVELNITCILKERAQNKEVNKN